MSAWRWGETLAKLCTERRDVFLLINKIESFSFFKNIAEFDFYIYKKNVLIINTNIGLTWTRIFVILNMDLSYI